MISQPCITSAALQDPSVGMQPFKVVSGFSMSIMALHAHCPSGFDYRDMACNSRGIMSSRIPVLKMSPGELDNALLSW